jgi:hypothetical protein
MKERREHMMILLLRQEQIYRQGRAWREMATVHVVALRDGAYCRTGARFTVGASMLAMVVNDNALNQMPRGALWFFASRLAPTG